MVLNVKSGLQNRILLSRKCLYDWKILRIFAAVNIQDCNDYKTLG